MKINKNVKSMMIIYFVMHKTIKISITFNFISTIKFNNQNKWSKLDYARILK